MTSQIITVSMMYKSWRYLETHWGVCDHGAACEAKIDSHGNVLQATSKCNSICIEESLKIANTRDQYT
jgi:hypothetical protein